MASVRAGQTGTPYRFVQSDLHLETFSLLFSYILGFHKESVLFCVFIMFLGLVCECVCVLGHIL